MAERKTPDNLFQRLTKLFRSGPSVKRKVKNYTKADKNASSAVELFKKAHSDVYNSTLSAYGTFDRMARYSDFSEMESTPEIASALDIYAEETCSQDTEGKVLHIHSNNTKIKELLHTLFYDTLDVNFNMVMWTRNLCKYGDFFLFNDISPEFGVINAYPVPITEIEREEGFDADDPSAVRYRWITQGNQILENWQVSHFRLLGNDAFLPYGSSVLEAARRIWRQLILIEDAMMVYRVIRAPERRVFYIDVGNVPPEDVATYVEQAKNSLKVNKVVGGNGNVDLRYNPMAVDEDYFIPVRGGDSGTRIDSLAGGQNTSAIEDVEYIQKKLFAALKIPKAYLGYDEDIGSKATLSQEDIRFSRSIARIQKTIIAELNKLAMIHLYAHGFDGEDLLDFSLALSNPSSLAQQQKLSLIEQKFSIAGGAPEGMVSKTWIYQNIFGFNKDTIEQIHNDLIREKLEAAEVEGAGAEGDDAGGDAGGGGGDLFAADKPEGQLLDAGTPIEATLGENDEFEDYSEDMSEDEEYIDLEKVSQTIGDGSIKADEVTVGVFGNEIEAKRDRSVRFGASELHMPDMHGMVTNKRSQDTMNDPYDSSWVRNWGKRDQMETKTRKIADVISGMDSGIKEKVPETIKPSMSFNTQRMLEKMNSKLGISKLMTEAKNYDDLLEEQFDLDFDINPENQDDE